LHTKVDRQLQYTGVEEIMWLECLYKFIFYMDAVGKKSEQGYGGYNNKVFSRFLNDDYRPELFYRIYFKQMCLWEKLWVDVNKNQYFKQPSYYIEYTGFMWIIKQFYA
jgi:hypothetical protein